MPDSTVAIAFMSHLRKERAAILAGDFKEIDDLYSSKETIFKDLALQHLSGNELATIQDALEKNQQLLRASIEGVSSAKARLSALREVREGLRVYDQSGQFADVSNGQNEINKRT
ncbi:MAG: flagellar protein FlgN [Loktanella sp.]|jgi:hypothetical protein|nr:flagellar protein FlgN [Loktanella sp.]MDO7660172.1 flagellar protein FlgN [Paracoccaceae bacterium]MDO7622950.1 flagellar protein FlgN [Loktanella sp.]MDO7625063.1 flagellar protein FlgN [Loktanella sp.]MDO7685522.1 flagellar protein FlgN [Loktanella sp.]